MRLGESEPPRLETSAYGERLFIAQGGIPCTQALTKNFILPAGCAKKSEAARERDGGVEEGGGFLAAPLYVLEFLLSPTQLYDPVRLVLIPPLADSLLMRVVPHLQGECG